MRSDQSVPFTIEVKLHVTTDGLFYVKHNDTIIGSAHDQRSRGGVIQGPPWVIEMVRQAELLCAEKDKEGSKFRGLLALPGTRKPEGFWYDDWNAIRAKVGESARVEHVTDRVAIVTLDPRPGCFPNRLATEMYRTLGDIRDGAYLFGPVLFTGPIDAERPSTLDDDAWNELVHFTLPVAT